MFRRWLASVVAAANGSMRKRLYVRLAAGGVVLALTVVAIAVAQRATTNRSVAQNAEQPSDGSLSEGPKKPAGRAPQPITPTTSTDEYDQSASLASVETTLPPDDSSRYATTQYADDSGDDGGESAYYSSTSDSPSPYSDSQVPSDPYGSSDPNSRYGSPTQYSGAYGTGAASATRVQLGDAAADEAYADGEADYDADARYAAAETPAEDADDELMTAESAELADEDEPMEEDAYASEPATEGDEYEYESEGELVAEDAGEGEEYAESAEDDEYAASDTAAPPPAALPGAAAGAPAAADTAGSGSRFSLDDNPATTSAAPPPSQSPTAASTPGSGAPRALTPPAPLSPPPGGAQPLPPTELPSSLSATPSAAPTPTPAQDTANVAPPPATLQQVPQSPRALAPTRPPVASSMNSGARLPDAGAAAAMGSGASATPGPDSLSGVQSPALTLEKIMPAEVQVGRPATFELRIRNVGQATAHEVVVTDRVPEGTELTGTAPEAQLSGDMLIWRLPALQPGGETTVSMQVVPREEGELGSVAQVTFAAQAAARTRSTRPNVVLEVAAAPQVLVGDTLTLAIVLRNDGSGAAHGLYIEADVPEGLVHPAGRELENEVGSLLPGQSRSLNLALHAEQASRVATVVRVRDDAELSLVKEVETEVIAPQIQLDVAGPTLRYLQRQAVYEIQIGNVGTATARNVELVARLPAGMKFVSADKLGQYDAARHEVYWSIDELPVQKSGIVALTVLPTEPGNGVIRVEGFAELAEPQVVEHQVRVASVSELSFTVLDTADPIEVGSDTVYEIELTNRGGKADTNVVVTVVLPNELEAIDAEGPTRGAAQGQQVQFEPIPQLGPGARMLYKITARGRTPSDARIVVQVHSDDTPRPISKEESTRIYSD